MLRLLGKRGILSTIWHHSSWSMCLWIFQDPIFKYLIIFIQCCSKNLGDVGTQISIKNKYEWTIFFRENKNSTKENLMSAYDKSWKHRSSVDSFKLESFSSLIFSRLSVAKVSSSIVSQFKATSTCFDETKLTKINF